MCAYVYVRERERARERERERESERERARGRDSVCVCVCVRERARGACLLFGGSGAEVLDNALKFAHHLWKRLLLYSRYRSYKVLEP